MSFECNSRSSKFRRYLVIISILNLFYSVQLSSAAVKITRIAPPLKHGESPYWDVMTQKLIYLDVFGKRILRYDPVTGHINHVKYSTDPCSLVVGVEGTPNQFLVGCGKDINVITWNQEKDAENPPIKRLAKQKSIYHDTFNDGKCDSMGRLWAGTIGKFDENLNIEKGQGTLYKMGHDLQLFPQYRPIDVANGLTWNRKEDKFYYIDSFSLQIWGFDYDILHGSISNKKVVFDLRTYNISGFPDGLTVDTDDNLWLTAFGGKGIANIDPSTGKLLRWIDMPVSQVTSVAFGGPEMNVLFVTSSDVPSIGAIGFETQGEPNAGSLYAIEGLGVTGFPHHRLKLIQSPPPVFNN